ncbi:MAG: 16S rRNA (uracil(1498)-N(3))-methyltransferase, partial [bacterium]|nr:16S rRNA (uracil(1498)-N(3))-methyltransferase [bacterium]
FAADGQGNEYAGEYIEQTGSDSGKFSITNTRIRPTEPHRDVILLQALIKGDRFDTLVEKAVEIGVSRIIPVITDRCIVKPSANKSSRWRRIALAAMKQSRRSILPEIPDPAALEEVLKSIPEADSAKFVLAGDSPEMLAELIKGHDDRESIYLLAGPEGDLTSDETAKSVDQGFRAVSLGPRRLRSETAGIMSVSVVLAYN